MDDGPTTTSRSRRAARVAIASTAAVLALLVPAGASAQQLATAPSPQEAEDALAQAQEVLAGEGDSAGEIEPTIALNQLAGALPQLEGGDRGRARALLARPTDGADDQYGDGYSPGVEVKAAASANFCVFWATEGPDAPPPAGSEDGSPPDYVDELLAIAEFSRSIEVAPGTLGWAPPKPDKEGCGPDPSTRADIYLKNVGAQRLFGYESPDPGQGRARSQYGYMVLDNDFAEFPNFADPLDAARVTFAHEYNHLLQQNYDSFQDRWMFESTATWVEEHVYPEINDYLNYIAAFARFPGLPITEASQADPASLKIYGSAAWNHWLATGGGGYGVGVIRDAWDRSDTGKVKDFAPAAYDAAIRAAGGRGFEREFVDFMAATAEWNTGFGGLPDATLYAQMRRKGSLGRAAKSFKLDHTSARLMRVRARGAKAKLRVSTEKGLRAGIALVGRRPTGEVVAKTKFLPKGRRGSVILPAPSGFDRITAVVVNADPRVRGFGGDDWLYSRDRQRFVAQVG